MHLLYMKGEKRFSTRIRHSVLVKCVSCCVSACVSRSYSPQVCSKIGDVVRHVTVLFTPYAVNTRTTHTNTHRVTWRCCTGGGQQRRPFACGNISVCVCVREHNHCVRVYQSFNYKLQVNRALCSVAFMVFIETRGYVCVVKCLECIQRKQ